MRLAGRDLSHTILLTGSSIMEQWHTAQEDLLPLASHNIAIGGTRLGDNIAFFGRLVQSHPPRVLVIYAGSNDMNGRSGESLNAEQTAALAGRYFDLIRARLLLTPVVYIGIIEAPCKLAIRDEIRAANELIRADVARRAGFHFIDCAAAMQDEHNEPDGSLYVEDRLHLNARGYVRWGACIRAGLFSFLGGSSTGSGYVPIPQPAPR